MARRRQKRPKHILKNYGILWDRERVFWGRGRARGQLLGGTAKRPVDFRDQIGVYVLYDDAQKIVYVGQAGRKNQRIFARLKGHLKNHLAPRWRYFSWFGLLSVNKDGSLSGWDSPQKNVTTTIAGHLDGYEGVLIAASDPQFNRQGARFRSVRRYSQVTHPRSQHVSLRSVSDVIAKSFHTVYDAQQSLADEQEKILEKLKKLSHEVLSKRKRHKRN
jgi:hypothetical protein